MSTLTKRIGLLATGSELVTGDILNTNGQTIAKTLVENGMWVGEHVVVDDTQSNLETCFQFLLGRHDAVITTGGLGPTSDDCTRDAIANITNCPLFFHEPSWQKIVARYEKRGLTIPEMNRQQAYFPKGARVLDNPNGTADAFILPYQNKLIFVLPGPPKECLPIFNDHVLPTLEKANFDTQLRLHRWQVTGIGESSIAEKLEAFGKPHQLQFGYRAHAPFVEIKLYLDASPQSEEIKAGVSKIVTPYLSTL